MKKKVERLFLIWLNDFLTVNCFAEYLGISKEKAIRIIRIGHKINNA